MLVNAHKLKKMPIVLSEQDTGKITDFHFDDLFWRIRHIGIKAGGHNKINFIVVSRYQTGDQQSDPEFFPLYKPLNYNEDGKARMELKRWNEFSQTPVYQAGPLVKIRQGNFNEQHIYEAYKNVSSSDEKDYQYLRAHIREIRAIIKSDLICSNGKAGWIKDVIIETNNWKIRYLVVQASDGNRSEKDILISPTWIKKIEWQNNDVYLNVNKNAILDSPAYDPEKPITNDFELRILRYYSDVRSGVE